LLLAFPESQIVVRVAPDGTVSSGDCQPDSLAGPLPGASLLQAVLDDPGFADRLFSAGAPVPLRVSFEVVPSGTGNIRFNGRPVVVERDARLVHGGQTLHLLRPERMMVAVDQKGRLSKPSDVVAVRVSFPAMEIDEDITLEQKQGTWKVLSKARTRSGYPLPPPDLDRPPSDSLVTRNGVAYKVLTKATGLPDPLKAVEPWTTVVAEIVVWTSKGELLFPQELKRPGKVHIPLALAAAGLAEGILGMSSLESRRIWLPAKVTHPAPLEGSKDLVVDFRLLSIAKLEAPASLDSEPPPASASKTSSGLAYVLHSASKAENPRRALRDMLTFSFKAWTQSGVGVAETPDLFFFVMAAPSVLLIPGLTEAMDLMKPKDSARVWIPANLAYGEHPRFPKLSAGPLVVDIALQGP
jgi:hypothetical protein